MPASGNQHSRIRHLHLSHFQTLTWGSVASASFLEASNSLRSFKMPAKAAKASIKGVAK